MIDLEKVKNIELFENFTQQELESLFEKAHEMELRPGEILFHEGETGTEMYIVTSGEIEIYKELGVDEPKLLVSLPEGAFIGEMSLIDMSPRSAMIRASENNSVNMVVFSRNYIENIALSNIDAVCKFMHNIIRISAGRSRMTTERLISSRQTLENINE